MRSTRMTWAVAGGSIAAIVLLGLVSPTVAATDDEIEQAIVDGLAWLAGQQDGDGSWGPDYCERVAATGLAVLKFEDRARELGFDDPMDPDYEYHQEVIDGLAYIISHAHDVDISGEPAADGDGDDLGVVFNNCLGTHDVYNSGIGMMALAASQRPDLYGDHLQDAVDWMSFAQNNPECGVHSGGWRYGANPCDQSDNSTSGYATLGLGYAGAAPPIGFGLTVPQFVPDRLDSWIGVIQDPVNGDANDGGSYYTPGGGGANILRTGNLLYEMRMVGDTSETQRVMDAVDYIERTWNDLSSCGAGWVNHRQAMFTMMKGLEVLHVDLIDLDNDGVPEHDWFDEVSTHLVNTQNADGSWPLDCWGGSQVLSTAWALLTLEKTVPPLVGGRVDVAKKGSLLVYPKVELKWNANGVPIQDTFVTILNDYPDDVFIHWYFVNGDEPLDAIFAGDPPTEVERAHPGWNWVNCVTNLTQNEPTYFSALTGSGGCQPFTTLDNVGGIIGRRDRDPGNPGGRVLRGYALVYAMDRFGHEISWNHLSGGATLVNYADKSAWEYRAYAFQATAPQYDQTDDAPGQLLLDGSEYDVVFNKLLLDFYAVGSRAFGGGVWTMLDTDLTLLPMTIDLQQDSAPPVITKAHFDIWNQNEDGFSGTARCITCWDQTLLSRYGMPNHFMMNTIHTDKGKARINGVASDMCDPEDCMHDAERVWLHCSQDAALLGVAAKILVFDGGAVSSRAYSGSTLVGQGEEEGIILADIVEPPGSLVNPDPDSEVTPPRALGTEPLRGSDKRSRR